MMNAGVILERVLDPVTQCLTPDAAHRIGHRPPLQKPPKGIAFPIERVQTERTNH